MSKETTAKMKIKNIIFITLLFLANSIFAQDFEINRVEPPNWFTGMKNSELQIMVYGKNIGNTMVEIKSEDIKLIKANKTENPNYLFLDIEILPSAKPGIFQINFIDKYRIVKKYQYELKEKTDRKRGFSSEDLIYLIMPDRFANGIWENDSNKLMLEKPNRKNPNGRHGGDIQGVINKLDYLKQSGFTALWLNPVLENNMPEYSYHGYAITDFYNVDPRHGSNQDYKRLSDECHKRDMKIIMDMIFNHCGSNHWWLKDLPSKDWLNNDSKFNTNYRGEVIADPNASQYDINKMNAGWFVATMPDLNQHNPFLAKYLIQNSIWWIQFADLDGIRMDTQAYPFKDFMSDWAKAVHNEYPDITLLGETWLQAPAFCAYFQSKSPAAGNYDSNLNSVTDFPLYYALNAAFNETDTWTNGLLGLYYVFAQDFLYADANQNVIFLDNHDLNRYFTSVGENINKYKMGMAVLLTSRGIPCLYYGSEIAQDGLESMGHGYIRQDFPGGWQTDSLNAFNYNGRNQKQNEIYSFVTKIANWRKTNKAVTTGKFLHFIPENNVYVYFRYSSNSAVMVILNNSEDEKRTVELNRFNEILKDYNSGTEIISDKKINKLDKINIDKKSVMIIELSK
jgi:glycosidase